MSDERREAYLAERTYGNMNPVDIARYINDLQNELERAKHAAQLPGWHLLVILVALVCVVRGGDAGDPMALWTIRGAVAFYVLGWLWVIVLTARDYLSKKRGG